MDPERKLLLAIDVGDRTRAIAQRLVHHVAQVLAPDCAPLLLTDGFREYMTALLTHYGHWVYPQRRQGQGPAPKPRWMPLPGLLYAQVIKTVRRRRLVRVSHRVVFGTLEAVQQVLAAHGWVYRNFKRSFATAAARHTQSGYNGKAVRPAWFLRIPRSIFDLYTEQMSSIVEGNFWHFPSLPAVRGGWYGASDCHLHP